MASQQTTSFGVWLTRRLVVGVITLLIVVTLTFFLLRLMPGSPFDNDKGLSPAVQAALEARFHLDEPLLVQFGLYLKGLFMGDLGPSLTQEGRQVGDMVMEAMGISFGLGGLALGLGIPLGVGAAILHNQTPYAWLKATLNSLASFLLASPSFLVAGVLILGFSVGLGLLPAATLVSPLHWVLPTVTLAVVPFTFAYLLMKQSITDEASALYLQMKRAAGLAPKAILFRHLLRNAWLPLLSLAAPLVANLMTGSFAVEVLYAIPGLGRQFVSGIINRDYTVVLGSTILYATALLLFNILADALAATLDPRLREGQR